MLISTIKCFPRNTSDHRRWTHTHRTVLSTVNCKKKKKVETPTIIGIGFVTKERRPTIALNRPLPNLAKSNETSVAIPIQMEPRRTSSGTFLITTPTTIFRWYFLTEIRAEAPGVKSLRWIPPNFPPVFNNEYSCFCKQVSRRNAAVPKFRSPEHYPMELTAPDEVMNKQTIKFVHALRLLCKSEAWYSKYWD